jgi:hypothetical protein
LLHDHYEKRTTLLTTHPGCSLPVIWIHAEGKNAPQKLLVLPGLGSQETLITTSAVKRLGLEDEIKKLAVPAEFEGLGSSKLPTAYYALEIKLISDSKPSPLTIVVKAKMIDFIAYADNKKDNMKEPIDLLLSAADSMNLIQPQEDYGILRLDTRFGTISTNTVKKATNEKSKINIITKDKELEVNFNTTTSTDEKRRIVVTLPFKCSPDMISNTRPIATRRFHWLKKKFEREPVFAEK